MFTSNFHNGPTPNYPPREGDISPWGQIQFARELIYGITIVSTAGHGGMLLSPERLEQMPGQMRSHDGWYEEDCEVAMPMLIFFDEFDTTKQWAQTPTREELRKNIREWCMVEV